MLYTTWTRFELISFEKWMISQVLLTTTGELRLEVSDSNLPCSKEMAISAENVRLRSMKFAFSPLNL